jgi:hypothetical protein
MNIDLLNRVADWTEANPDSFNMASWFNAPDGELEVPLADVVIGFTEHTCGYVACIGGTAVLLHALANPMDTDAGDGWRQRCHGQTAAELLGLSEQCPLFYADRWPVAYRGTEPEHLRAVRLIRDMIAGTVDLTDPFTRLLAESPDAEACATTFGPRWEQCRKVTQQLATATPEQLWDARAARDARDAWAARDARDAWAARDARDARAARAAWAAWDARAARAAWAARDAWDAWAARDARDAWAARAARDAWDAIFAIVAKDWITAEQYTACVAPWESVFGSINLEVGA